MANSCSARFSDPIFKGDFGGIPVFKMGDASYRWKPQMSISNDIKFSQIEVRTEKLWLPEVGVSELFFRIFPVKILAKRGKLPANRELHVVAGVVIFLTHPGSLINSQRAGRNSRAKAVVREEKRVRFSAHFLIFVCVRAHG